MPSPDTNGTGALLALSVVCRLPGGDIETESLTKEQTCGLEYAQECCCI
jgi:hypothetical protein